MKVSDGFPITWPLARKAVASAILRPYETFQNPFFLDSVRTGFSQAYRAVRMRSDLVAFAAVSTFKATASST